AAVKEEVIALSEEFNIITPYTSLLVLETDADRARFAVKRRFQMRDGERFFADGRDNANFELRQKQMRLAGAYRTELRHSVLAQLNTLGRYPQLFQRRLAGSLPNGRSAGLNYNSIYPLAGMGPVGSTVHDFTGLSNLGVGVEFRDHLSSVDAAPAHPIFL